MQHLTPSRCDLRSSNCNSINPNLHKLNHDECHYPHLPLKLYLLALYGFWLQLKYIPIPTLVFHMIQELFSIYNNQIYKSHIFQPNQTIIIQIDYIFSFISMNNETLVHYQPLITSSIVSSTYYKKHTNDNHLISFHHLDSSMIQSKFETIYNSHSQKNLEKELTSFH